MRIKPASRPGRIAGWLALAFLVDAFVVNTLIASRREVADALALGPLHLPGLVAFALAIAAGAAAIVALARHQDRALVVWLALVPATVALLFELGEAFL